MAINFDNIESIMAATIGTEMSDGINGNVGNLNIPPEALTPIVAILNWDGSTTILTTDTSEFSDSGGEFLKLDADGGWFRTISLVTDTSIVIENLYNLTIPTGSTSSSKSPFNLPEPADANSIEDSLGVAIAKAVRDALETFADDAEISGVDAGTDTVGPGVIS